jgi:polysaccharide export outer membrane protein
LLFAAIENEKDEVNMEKTKLVGLAICTLLFYASPEWALQVPISKTPGDAVRPPSGGHLPSYVLGPNDEIVIVSVVAEDIANKPTRITTSGDLNLPMVGRIHAAGMTLDQLETEVSQRLKKYYRDPDLSINVTQFKSQPVSVIGYVGTPGVIQLEGRKNLIEVLSQVGGLRPEAGSRVKITRKSEWGPIPLPSAKTQGDLSIAEVSVRGIETATSPEENIQILPNDIITVPRADIIYVLGEVKMPGGFALDERGRTISLIEVLARAGGATPTAALKNAKIVRAVPNSNRIEIAVNLKDVTKGKAKDMVLQPDDILYVPNSYAKGAFRRTLDTVVNTATAVAIYRY